MNLLYTANLLPADTIDQKWFKVLLVFVAINTLVFATISLAKMWPRKEE